MYLGIDRQSGLVYEGLEGPVLPVVPRPTVTQGKLIKREEDWNDLPTGIAHSPMSWVFREDTFDPVTRARRGRLFEPEPAQPVQYRVLPDPYEDPRGRSVGAQGRTTKNLYAYKACVSLLREPHRGMGLKLALGVRDAASAWRIIQTEVVANGCVMVTLKSLSAFGILPAVDVAKIPVEFEPAISQTVERALNAAFRETPISVIDQCRNTMTVLLSRWLVASGHDPSILGADLGKIGEIVGRPPYEKGMVSNLAKVVARLHSRGKTNEAHTKGLRDPVDEDAELALHVLGFTLRDIGWANGT
ncbi:hypothetical protein JQ604_16080 [Bradyrhizobium jicamae]|uniref:hypothetical protein n=1 Tax=Bradyrhizobium jicamae TaxID=280332 RepID=UPI001BA6D482|nr:hypothetical protein [Bradyrhizobium jicamae]MBR0753707.1 hypothetical protein [Bradyrhizobium jicamae]